MYVCMYVFLNFHSRNVYIKSFKKVKKISLKAPQTKGYKRVKSKNIKIKLKQILLVSQHVLSTLFSASFRIVKVTSAESLRETLAFLALWNTFV